MDGSELAETGWLKTFRKSGVHQPGDQITDSEIKSAVAGRLKVRV